MPIAVITALKSPLDSHLDLAIDNYSSIYNSLSFSWYVQANGLTDRQQNVLTSLPFVFLSTHFDSSIYEAWNICLSRIGREDKICFLGIDDFPSLEWFNFAESIRLREYEILSSPVRMKFSPSVYGRIRQNPPLGPVNLSEFPYCHPGLLFSPVLFAKRRFLSDYKVISDGLFYSQFIRLIVKASFPSCGVVMSAGGISNSRRGSRMRFVELLHATINGRVSYSPRALFRILASLPAYLLSFLPSSIFIKLQSLRWLSFQLGES